MICGFFHDVNLYSLPDGKKYSVDFPYKLWDRYLKVFDKLLVVTRQEEMDQSSKKLEVSSGENVEFLKVENFIDLKNLNMWFLAKRTIKAAVQRIDCAIIRLPSFIGNLAVKECIKQNKPYLIELVSCPWDALWNHSFIGKLVAPYMYFKTKFNIKSAKYVLYVTSRFLQKRYPTNGKSIDCSDVVLGKHDDKVLEKRISKIKSNKGEKLIIGTTAAVNVKYKGQQYVIKALGELKRQGITSFEYQLVGGGDSLYLQSIAEKNNVSDCIKFLGAKSHKEVYEWLDTVDIYVQPSRQEGLPRALVEAMSRGVPAFGANTGGIPELLDSNYIFSNTKNNISEICKILLTFNNKSMENQAKRNFEESKKYDEKSIEVKRHLFYKEFVMNVSKN